MRLESVCPSAFGVIVRGTAVAERIARATAFAPIVPVALRTVSPAAIVHEYDALRSRRGVPGPVDVLARAGAGRDDVPVESATVTVQGSDSERCARKRTCPPIAPRTVGRVELRQPDRRCLLRDRAELGVERSPGTRREARVAMA